MPGHPADSWDINLLRSPLPSILPGACKVSSDTVHVFQELLMMPSKGIEAKVMAIDGPSETDVFQATFKELSRALGTPGDTCP